MKTKRNLIIAVCLCLSSYCMAERTTFQERTENWLRNAPGESGGSGTGRPEIDDKTNMREDPGAPSPVGDAIWLLAGMSAVYAFCRCKPGSKSDERLPRRQMSVCPTIRCTSAPSPDVHLRRRQMSVCPVIRFLIVRNMID